MEVESIKLQFDTHHIVTLFGVVSNGQPALVVTEFFNENLIVSSIFSYSKLLKFSGLSQIPPTQCSREYRKQSTTNTFTNSIVGCTNCYGMAYLETKKVRYID